MCHTPYTKVLRSQVNIIEGVTGALSRSFKEGCVGAAVQTALAIQPSRPSARLASPPSPVRTIWYAAAGLLYKARLGEAS